MYRTRRAVPVLVIALGWLAPLSAAVTTTMIDLPTGVPTRILDIHPDGVVANIVTIPGASGYFGITGNAIPSNQLSTCHIVTRSASAWTARHLGIVLVDSAFSDIAAVASYLWNRDHVPVWIHTGSATASVGATAVGTLPPTIPVGVLFWVPSTVTSTQAEAITRHTQVIYHVDDPLSNTSAPFLYDHLVSAPVRELLGFSGGIPYGECFGGLHVLWGLDVDYVAAVTAFIDKWNGALQVVPDGPLAVEYFNAGFGHYFLTADADEIAGLDAGAYNFAFVRTGKSFKVLDAPGANTVPVCRFFTTPGTFGAKSSHFYTANPAECDGLKLNPNWIYEKIAFHIAVPSNGACAAGTVPVYRAYNDGQTGAPNHRFTTDLATYQQFTTTLGWLPEGVAFCAPA